MKKTPYQHQQDAFKAIIQSLRAGEVPYVNISTGGGKALVSAMLADKCLAQGGRTLILVPSSELCLQNAEECFEYIDDKSSIGICSAKMGKFQVSKKIVVATYTSFLKRRASSGFFNLLVVDEAHFLSPLPTSSYQKIITSLKRINPKLNICGLTATPYRNTGVIHEDNVEGKRTFTECCYETSIPELIKSGHLSNIVSISGDIQIDLDGVRTIGSDYSSEDVGRKFAAICSEAVADMKEKFIHYGIRTALVFASTVKNAEEILKEWGDNSTMRIIHGELSNHERNATINWLKNGNGMRVIVNVQILTVGFNHAQLDCVCMMRSTKSVSLYIQCVGRVLRAHKDKEISYYLDYGKNLQTHGQIDNITPPKTKKKLGDMPMKLCAIETCQTPNRLSAKVCIKCDAEFISTDETGNYVMRTRAEILAAKLADSTKTYPVTRIVYDVHTKEGSPDMIKMKFVDEDSKVIHSHYLMFNHKGFARDNSLRFFMRLFKRPSDYYKLGTAGITTESALLILQQHAEKFIKPITAISLLPKGRFNEIKAITFIEEEIED